jgi:uncharacterized repeat protein (TIGR03803 family)
VIPSNVTFLSWPRRQATTPLPRLAVLWRMAAAAAVLIAPHTALAQTTKPPQAVVTVLASFAPNGLPNGTRPHGGFILGNDGNFYGTLEVAGPLGAGTIYRITPSGGFQLLYSFMGGADGTNPSGPLADRRRASKPCAVPATAFRDSSLWKTEARCR